MATKKKEIEYLESFTTFSLKESLRFAFVEMTTTKSTLNILSLYQSVPLMITVYKDCIEGDILKDNKKLKKWNSVALQNYANHKECSRYETRENSKTIAKCINLMKKK